MKSRFLIYVLLLLLVILAAILGWRHSRYSTKLEPTTTTQITNNVLATPANVGRSIVPATSPVKTSPTASTTSSVITNRPSPQDIVERFIENKNVPVEFYGQVIDQDSNALAGVSVKAVVVQLTMPDPTAADMGAKNIPIEQVTGADGRFEISGVQGASFDLEPIQKEGYEAEFVKRGHDPTGGTFDQPVIFKMWNTNIHEQLITGNKSFDITPDGRTYFIDLTTDTINESGVGDLKIWVQYTNQVVRGQLYDWSAGIEVSKGGLLEKSLGSPMFSAPADGYTAAFQLQQQIKGGQRGHIGSRQFYIMLKNGQEYGQMTIDLYAPFNDQTSGLVCLSYAINPSGSRILR